MENNEEIQETELNNEENQTPEEIEISAEYTEITNKLDEVIYYQQHNYSLSIITVSCFAVALAIYIMYRFISSFIEF